VCEKNLEAARGPPELLLGVGLDRLRRVAHRKHLGDEDSPPSPLVQHQRGPHVLRLRVGVHAADVDDGRAPEHHIGAYAERGVEAIPAGLNEAIEHRLHVAGALGDGAGARVAVGLRRLHECELVVGEEGQRLFDEVGLRHEVGVEDHKELARGE